VWILDRGNTISATRISSIRFDIANFLPSGSAISGRTKERLADTRWPSFTNVTASATFAERSSAAADRQASLLSCDSGDHCGDHDVAGGRFGCAQPAGPDLPASASNFVLGNSAPRAREPRSRVGGCAATQSVPSTHAADQAFSPVSGKRRVAPKCRQSCITF
jgi:hypothetical protein